MTNKLWHASPVIAGILRRRGRLLFGFLPVVFMLLCLGTPTRVHAQTTATVSGTVEDTTGAVIPGATVTLINQATHTQVDAVTTGTGLYAFPSLIPGTYNIRAIAKGFAPKELSGVVLNAGDTKEMPPLELAVGNASQTVTVQAITQMIPMNTGTRSDVLDYSDIQNIDLQGRDVTEMLKVLPGVVESPNGLSNGPTFNAITVTAQTSAVGNGLNISGAEYRGPQALLSDGVDVIDPGDMGGSIGTVTPEMTQEVSVLTSDFGADQEFGPVVVSTISRSGGDQYHGEAYFDARNDALNANDWLSNHGGHPKAGAAYYYPGGNFGGPVPRTHKKLFFFGGYERWLQNQGNANILESYIPTPAMLSGDFTTDNAANVTLCGYNGGNFTSTDTGHWCNDLTGTDLPAGDALIPAAAGQTGNKIPADDISPAAAALSSFWPKVYNSDGSTNTAAGYSNPATTPGNYNYYEPIINHVNGWVWRARVDWHWTDKTQAYISYQQEFSSSLDQGNGAHIYWTPGGSIPYPGGGLYQYSYTKTAAGHLIHEFSPTLTNELIASWGEGNLPNQPANPSGALRTTLGYPTGAGYGEVFAPGSKLAPAYNESYTKYQMPDFSQGDDYEPSGVYQVRKEVPAFADNLTKVIGAHTVKVGAFTQNTLNYQGGGQQMNGIFNTFQLGGNVHNDPFLGYAIGSPNNPTANFVMGVVPSYSEANKSPNSDMAYQNTAAYINDNWKVTRRVTVEIGARFEHVGHWYDRTGNGMAVFFPDRVVPDYYAGKTAPGFYWHGIDNGIPLSGYPNRLFFLSPRFGLSVDLFGNGKTLVRGGWGAYRWADQYNDYANMLQSALDIRGYGLPGQTNILEGEVGYINTPLGQSLGLAPAGVPGSATFCQPASGTTLTGTPCTPGISGGEEGANPTDYGMPLTYTWNLTIDQQLPWNSLFDIAYVGSSSSQMDDNGEESNGSNFSGFANQNKVPIGAFFKPDPITGIISQNPENLGEQLDGTSIPNKEADYHPYSLAYGANAVTMDSMLFYSNYNALQASWTKRSGRFIFNFNYTWQKQLGTAAYQINAFNDRADYGVLNVDRPWLFNSDYIYQFGNLLHSNAVADGLVNGWTISGITSLQGGGNLQNEQGATLGMGLQYVNIPGTVHGVGSGVGSNTYYGTDGGLSILPAITCNPKSGLKSNQILNLACFTAPAIGQQGGQNFPYLSNAKYIENDLAIYKTFNVHEQQNVQFRLSAFNWMNHPLPQVSSGNQIAPFYTIDYQTHQITWVPNHNSSSPGILDSKSGTPTQRIIELNVKYNF